MRITTVSTLRSYNLFRKVIAIFAPGMNDHIIFAGLKSGPFHPQDWPVKKKGTFSGTPLFDLYLTKDIF